MTFEEFFKKKKISLPALQSAEAGLFSEFKEHFELMGEKSFDHTKKYWFNKLRRLYPLPPEPKVEKEHLENRLAEQAIAESLTEPVPAPKAPPKPGFTPRFRAGATIAKPAEKFAEQKQDETTPAAKPSTEANHIDKPAETAVPKVGFKPRFKAGVTGTKTSDTPPQDLTIKESATVTPEVNQAAAEQAGRREEDPLADTNEVKPAFQQEKEVAQDQFGDESRTPEKLSPEEFVEDKKQFVEEKPPEDQPAAPKLGFKPRFKQKE